MVRNFSIRQMAFLFITPLLIFIFASLALANGEVTETEYSTSLSEATGIVRVIVAILGGLIAVLGIVLAFRGIGGKADVELSLSDQRKITFRKISQGVVIVIIGAAISVAAVYLLPEKWKERLIKGKEITIEREGNREKMLLKK